MPVRPARRTRAAAVVAAACLGLLGSALAAPSLAAPSLAAPSLAAPSLAAPSVAAPSATGGSAAQAGRAGIGDPYFPQDGNGGYDVAHYDIHDRYDIAGGSLDGWTVVAARTTQRLSSFNLDLVLDVDAVRLGVDGTPPEALSHGTGPGTWHRSGRHELVIAPATPLPAGVAFEVRVDYHGVPGDIGVDRNKPWLHDKVEAMATNEPQIAPWWFPANDHPRDKATFDIEVAVPSGNQAISNGVLLDRADDGTWSIWRWRMDQPMAPYLAFFAAGRFEIEQGTRAGFPYLNAVSKQLSPANQDRALKLMRRTPRIVAWLEGQFGDYPYATTGGVTTSLYSGFALENQSRPTYPYLGDGSYARTVVVHELAHQWFGDQVSVRRWRDVWLNEGLASWVEWRYAEAHGRRSAQKTLLSHYSAYLPSDPLWNLHIGDPGPKKLFRYAVYERGAMAVQALRHRIGNADFARLLRTWVSRRQDRTGRIGQFRHLAEQVSGQDLRRFFHTWLDTGYKPARTKANGLR